MCTPERTCIGCRSKRPQTALLRVVIGSGGSLTVSRTAPGRGAWLCNPPAPCLELAKKRRGFERAFRRTLPEGALDELMGTAGHENRDAEGGVVSLSASDEAPAEERQDAACVAGERN